LFAQIEGVEIVHPSVIDLSAPVRKVRVAEPAARTWA
jgi:hypothetical protein